MAENENVEKEAAAVKRKRMPLKQAGVILLALIIVGGGGYAALRAYRQNNSSAHQIDLMNAALRNNDRKAALADAKKALAKDPHNVDTILSVANIDSTLNPNEAKQYFKQALDEFKKQDNPDISGKSATTYWAAAGLAEQAGETDQAKQYYQEVIKAARPSNSYDQSIAAQSQAALKRLQ